ncbi:DNA-binding protein [Actinoplanes sp. SE50]|uniref:helix-turn-helix domain-containing protein n=1 Tax=unclassified Actinoplanes TaxID=2626549 RepID=UPI00023EC562|nr:MULTISPECIES: helix-turn-helix transcriptional regulator [unclassified Actinoplanes]AEV81412.1 helix-turn-helix domain-containing protein [Actinoplanes sp. SE50/110]ATO79815.1 DNA-binding protein [Actinoplanes sp. SE50]SLL97217.1 transcriptional regulator [Actinoplanes sp. SE50/110]
MAEGDSPTVARRRVRLAIREARERADLTQLHVAEAMEWSLSKVIRIENGDVSISPNDLRPLLSLLGIRDRAEVTALLADTRIARAKQRAAWYQTPDFRDGLTDATRKLVEYENESTEIRSYSIYYVPGHLQTPGYASALMTRFEDELSAEQIGRRIEARRLRRDSLLPRAASGQLEILVMVDESVLRRTIGGPVVFAEQLGELAGLATNGAIRMRMVPFRLDAAVTNNASFDLLAFGEGEVLYRETGLGDEMIEDREATAKHRARFDKVWHEAADEDDTITFIRQQITALENRDHNRGARAHT